MKAKISNAYLKKLKPDTKGQKIIRDTDLPGYMAVQGKRGIALSAQFKGKRQKLFDWDGENEPLARAAALIAREKGFDEKPLTGPTLREAWQSYRKELKHKNRSPRTIGNYEDLIERVLKDWLDWPLAKLADNPDIVKQKHMSMKKLHLADHAMRALGIIYRNALKTSFKVLPPNLPTIAVPWNNPKSKKVIVLDLKAWNKKRLTLENGVRREFHLFSLLSGSRPDALTRARWEHLDVKNRSLHFPDPKGGEDRAFDMPLSRHMLASLARCRREGQFLHGDSEFIFPAKSASGHISEIKEPKVLGKEIGKVLRKTFATIAYEVTGEDSTVGVLLNHAQTNVTSRYIDYSALHGAFVKAQADISKEIMKRLC